MNYPSNLDNVIFTHWTIPKKSSGVRHVFEFNKELSGIDYCDYQIYSGRLKRMLSERVPEEIRTRTAYNKGVSIPHLINHLGGSKVFVQLDIVDFFNNVKLEQLDRYIPNAYYYNFTDKVGIKQGTNISGDITNMALYKFDKAMIERNPRYARYADDIIIGCDTMEEAEEVNQYVQEYMRQIGLEINTRKTMITDLTEVNDSYVKYLGYTIKRDKYNTDKLRVTMGRKKRHYWWAEQQHGHATSIFNKEYFTWRP